MRRTIDLNETLQVTDHLVESRSSSELKEPLTNLSFQTQIDYGT